MLLPIVVGTCDSIHMTEHMQVNSTVTSVGTAVNISCEDGYVMSSNNQSVMVMCHSNFTWSLDVTLINCTGIGWQLCKIELIRPFNYHKFAPHDHSDHKVLNNFTCSSTSLSTQCFWLFDRTRYKILKLCLYFMIKEIIEKNKSMTMYL